VTSPVYLRSQVERFNVPGLKTQAACIKGVVSLSGYKSFSLLGYDGYVGFR